MLRVCDAESEAVQPGPLSTKGELGDVAGEWYMIDTFAGGSELCKGCWMGTVARFGVSCSW